MFPLLFSPASTTIRFSCASGKVALMYGSRSGPPNGPVIATEPAAPSILNWGYSALDSLSCGLFQMALVVQDLFTMSQLVDFKQWPSVLEQLSQTHKPVCSQAAAAARLCHLRRVIDAVHLGVGALQHHEAAAGLQGAASPVVRFRNPAAPAIGRAQRLRLVPCSPASSDAQLRTGFAEAPNSC